MERYKGDRSPSFYTTVTIDGIPVDLTGGSAKFFMRPEASSTFKVNGAAATVVPASTTLSGDHVLPDNSLTVADTSGFLDSGALLIGGNYFFYEGKTATTFTRVTTEQRGTLANGAAIAQIGGLRYDPTANDVNMDDVGTVERADYLAFFEVTLSSKTQKTPPFQVTFVDLAFASSDLCSLLDVRAELDARDNSTFREEKIRELLPIASRLIMDETQREFAPAVADATRRFRVEPGSYCEGHIIRLAPYDLRTITTVTLNPEASSPNVLTTADWILDPQASLDGTFQSLILRGSLGFGSEAYTRYGFSYVDIAGAWGFAAVPGPVKRACVRTVVAWLRNEPPAFIGEMENPRVFTGLVPGMFALPPDARKLLERYMNRVLLV